MVVPLLGGLEDDPGLLEEVGPHVGPDDVVVLVEVDVDVMLIMYGVEDDVKVIS